MPSIEMRPAVVGTRPMSAFRKVVLPTPLWPTMPTASPALQLEVDAVQHGHVAVGGAQSGDVEDDVARRRRRSPSGGDFGLGHLARLPM